MKINKIFIAASVALIILAGNNFLHGETEIYNYIGERIIYLISPFGKSEYRDFGTVDLEGKKVNLITFKTKVLFFEDTETIYSNPDDLLPIKVIRDISKFWIKEHLTEEYDQNNFTVTLRKFKRKKVISEQITKATGPIHNAITLPFYLRRIEGIKIGWSFVMRIPDEFKLELVSIDEIIVPAGKFQAYHFKSFPDKFEIWINQDLPRVPIKIKSTGALDYALVMKKYSTKDN